jgi:2-hydroxychromene-2-carboxylate isomerase
MAEDRQVLNGGGDPFEGRDMIDFWISVGSTYSYLAVMRLKSVEETSGVTFRWRPFSVRAIMIEQNNIPFVGKPVKMTYMWRDIGRRARRYGFSPRLPAPYPLKEFDLANQIAILAESEGWCAEYVRAAYRRWFEEGEEPAPDRGLADMLSSLGRDPQRVLAAAKTDEIEARYRRNTDEAKALGVFGSPTFVVGDEVFWGDDRLDDAIEFFKARAPAEGRG